MKIETLKERIEKATAKIERKENTIAKKTALIEKKADECEKEWLREDIARLNDEIEETKNTIAKYEKQLAGEMEKESLYTKEVPESMKRMETELITEWDEFDKKHRDELYEEKKTIGYEEFFRKHTASEYDLMYQSNEEIHRNNERDARMMVINLYNRVKAITGEVTDWSNLECELGNLGAVLTGYVIGKEGRAEVETILAGGYNIQRLHVRTLVHER